MTVASGVATRRGVVAAWSPGVVASRGPFYRDQYRELSTGTAECGGDGSRGHRARAASQFTGRRHRVAVGAAASQGSEGVTGKWRRHRAARAGTMHTRRGRGLCTLHSTASGPSHEGRGRDGERGQLGQTGHAVVCMTSRPTWGRLCPSVRSSVLSWYALLSLSEIYQD